MVTLSIRSLSDDTHVALRVHAVFKERSMEAEARQILFKFVNRYRNKPIFHNYSNESIRCMVIKTHSSC